MHYVNNADAVPTLTGLGGSVDPLQFMKDAGKGAVVHRFTDGNLNVISNHMLDTLYMKHRVSFDEARAGYSKSSRHRALEHRRARKRFRPAFGCSGSCCLSGLTGRAACPSDHRPCARS